MTQAPATPELVERLRDLTRFMTGTQRSRAMLDTADALEAQQARIAELEGLLKSLRLDWSALTNTGSAIAKINVRLIDQALSSSQGRHEWGEG